MVGLVITTCSILQESLQAPEYHLATTSGQLDLTVDYAYDHVGNRTFMRVTEPASVAEVTYEYNERDQLLRETRSGTTATGASVAYRTGPGPDAATAYRVRRPASFASAAAAAFGLCWLATFSFWPSSGSRRV